MQAVSTNDSIDLQGNCQSDEESEANIRQRVSDRKFILKITSITIFLILVCIAIGIWEFKHLKNEMQVRNKMNQVHISRLERRQHWNQLQKDYIHISGFAEKVNGIAKSSVSAINLSAVDQVGKKMSDLLYKNQSQNIERSIFNEERQRFIEFEKKPTIHLAKFNMIQSQGAEIEALLKNSEEWERLNKKYNLSNINKELSLCIIVPGYNNKAQFRIQYNLNSLFTQNYTNYKAVIINDASNDGSNQLYLNYFKTYSIPKDKYVYFFNQERLTALQNIYNGVLGQCEHYQIIITLDADDQLIGRNILQTFNSVHQSKLYGVIYSNFYWYQQNIKIQQGFTQQYTDQEKRNKLYRKVQIKFSHLRSFRRQLFMQIDPRDLQDKEGKFYRITYDMALFLPMLELSCGKIMKIQEQNYLYNIGTGMNDYSKQDGEAQEIINKQIRKKPKYNCSSKYQYF